MYLEHHKEQLDRDEIKILSGVYDEIRAKLNVYAKDRGLDLILLAANPDVSNVASLNEFRIQLATHSVLYYREDLDITADFIQYLDQQLAGAAANPLAPTIPDGSADTAE